MLFCRVVLLRVDLKLGAGDSPEGVLESRARLNWMYFNIFRQMEFATFRDYSAS